ncbi:MAG TPA: hypothetical protein VLX44_05990 [Xanthobacteraceae bacterium]|nr:hypothetical protein [Xanthobacteraceae bacterium]
MSERRVLAAGSVAELSRARDVPSPSIAPASLSPHAADTDKILASFNTWSFKREQPDDLPLLRRSIADAVAIAAPLSFVLYWGKGGRCRIAQPDTECLDYLGSLTRRVGEAYPHGAAVTLIFTDTHAELNGHAPASMRRYFGEVEAAARRRGFDVCRLGALTRAAGSIAGACADDPPPDLLARLLPSAQKWYRGHASHEQAALTYYRMNMVEARAVEQAFPRSIFVTFNGRKLRRLFPARMPIFFMYSLRRGVGIKPWFLPEGAEPCSDAVCRCEAAPRHAG